MNITKKLFSFAFLFLAISCSGSREPETLDDDFLKNKFKAAAPKIEPETKTIQPQEIQKPQETKNTTPTQYPNNPTYRAKASNYYEPQTYGNSYQSDYPANYNPYQAPAYSPNYNPYINEEEVYNPNRHIPRPRRSGAN